MKIKKIIYTFFAMFLLSPMVAFGQWTATDKGSGLPNGTITAIVLNVMNWILVLVGIIGIIGFVIAGIIYLTSAGDDTKIGTAKKAMTYCIIGIIVALMGYVIIKAADSMLNATTSF